MRDVPTMEGTMTRPLLARPLLCLILLLVCYATHASTEASSPPLPPSTLYGPLFVAVQNARLFADEKTFADMDPIGPPDQIVETYARMKSQRGFNLSAFVYQHFVPAHRAPAPAPADTRVDIDTHIETLWSELERAPDSPASPFSSQLALPRPYLAPGTRFNEIRYWDSYFLMLGLEADGRHAQAMNQIDDIASLIDRYGYMPASNRSYDLSRSSPPFFSLMVDLVARHDGAQAYRRYRPELELEYAYWMDGASRLVSGAAWRRAVRLSDGSVLNRYWDDNATPRDTSYRSDMALAQRVDGATQAATAKRTEALLRNLRASDESGWPASSRWMSDPKRASTLRTMSLIPVDLNALLYHLEITLAHAYRVEGDRAHAENMLLRAAQRKSAMQRLMWDSQIGAFSDLDWMTGKLTHDLTAATLYPLFAHVATSAQAATVAQTTREKLLASGGVVTSTVASGARWDAPFGWAPIQWIGIVGFGEYDHADLARTIAKRWVSTNLDAYARTGRLSEKYDVVAPAHNARLIASEMSTSSIGETGVSPVDHGAGWTAGVLRGVLATYPGIASAPASAAPATRP
ncbi:Periplasmic trehalase [Pararobbsia alpina]